MSSSEIFLWHFHTENNLPSGVVHSGKATAIQMLGSPWKCFRQRVQLDQGGKDAFAVTFYIFLSRGEQRFSSLTRVAISMWHIAHILDRTCQSGHKACSTYHSRTFDGPVGKTADSPRRHFYDCTVASNKNRSFLHHFMCIPLLFSLTNGIWFFGKLI